MVGGIVMVLATLALAIPNLLRPNIICAYVDSPDHALYRLEIPFISYNTTYHTDCPPSLAALGPPPEGQDYSAQAAGLIGADLASGTKNGYNFRLTCDHGKYTMTADPVDNRPDSAYFFVDNTLVIREEAGKPATASSPPSERDCSSQKLSYKTPAQVAGLLYWQVQKYEWIYNKYPPSLFALGPPPPGVTPDADAAYLIDAESASGKRFGYVFRYQSDGAGGFTIHADPASQPHPMLAWFLEKPHYFIDRTGFLREEAHGPAAATSRKWKP